MKAVDPKTLFGNNYRWSTVYRLSFNNSLEGGETSMRVMRGTVLDGPFCLILRGFEDPRQRVAVASAIILKPRQGPFLLHACYITHEK